MMAAVVAVVVAAASEELASTACFHSLVGIYSCSRGNPWQLSQALRRDGHSGRGREKRHLGNGHSDSASVMDGSQTWRLSASTRV